MKDQAPALVERSTSGQSRSTGGLGITNLPPVISFDQLPPPEMGYMALDLERTKDGTCFAWVVIDGEWVNVEIATHHVCPHCGR